MRIYIANEYSAYLGSPFRREQQHQRAGKALNRLLSGSSNMKVETGVLCFGCDKKMEIKLLQYKSVCEFEFISSLSTHSLALSFAKNKSKLISPRSHTPFLMFQLCLISFSMSLSPLGDLNMCNYTFIFSLSRFSFCFAPKGFFIISRDSEFEFFQLSRNSWFLR